MEFHPVTDLFPKLCSEDRESLKGDIRENGVQIPVLVWGEYLIDGRHRWEICEELGIDCPVTRLKGTAEEAERKAISLNMHRRHLSTTERTMIAAALVQRRLSTNEIEKPPPNGGNVQQDAIANAAGQLNVSQRSVERGLAVLSKGSAAIQEAVRNGEVKVGDAAAIVDLPKSEQNKALKKKKAGKVKTLRATKPKREPGEDDVGIESRAQRLARLAKSGATKPDKAGIKRNATATIGELTRALNTLGLLEKHRTNLDAILKDVKAA